VHSKKWVTTRSDSATRVQMGTDVILGQRLGRQINGGGANLVEFGGGGLRVYHCAAGHAT